MREFFRLLALLSLIPPASALATPERAPAPGASGAGIYLRGVLPGGEPLHGERAGLPGVDGATAACVNCHGRSGLGRMESGDWVPPITGRYLYHARGGGQLADPAHPTAPMNVARALSAGGPLPDRVAYTDATLARAIREGVGPDGHLLGYLMPRFRLADADMASLIAYLKPLSGSPSPGVGDTALEFATVITPDADPARRRAMLDVLVPFFGQQNVFTGNAGPPPQFSHRFSPVTHHWQLHVWELTGAPESWEAQLEERLRRTPVFAVISGVGGRTWEPVHRFCQRKAVPCLFPNVDLPVVAEQDFYDVYFSKGVLLEAQLIAARLRAPPEGGGTTALRGRVVQLYRSADIGVAAAAQLRAALGAAAPEVVDRVLEPHAAPAQIRAALSDVAADDVLVLWLRPQDIGSLPPKPPPAQERFLSGLMSGIEVAPLAPAWREVALMTYPFELSQRRGVNMEYPLGWMRFKHIDVTDERTQTDTYLACVITAETLSMMGENLLRDHLVEILEMHLGTRLVNGFYPRLGLAPGQRFASKGGLLVRFTDPQGPRLAADGDWSVP